MSNTKKPAFDADAAEEYFSDLLVYYRNTANDIFRRDNEGRHASEHIYSAEYQKYVGMQIAMREVLEYFSKYDLVDVQEVLGDDYDLDRLREIVEADRDGRCVVLPVPLHSVLLDMSDTCRPDVLKDFRISATWTHNGIVFYCPWNIFNQNIEKGYIRLMSESAESVLKGRYQNEDC